MTSDTENTLLEINNEIKSVYEYCLAAGLTHEEIVEKAKPLLYSLEKEDWKKTILTLLKLAICCIALSYTLSSDYLSRSVLSNGRYFMFQVLPYWDWTELYTKFCLVDNPFFTDQTEYIYDCHLCEDVFEVEYKNKTTPSEVLQYYMERNIPLIVSNAMNDWPVMQDTFSILNLTVGFNELKENVCMFQSNLGVKDHCKLFEKILNEDLSTWYAHWENCNRENYRMMRQFYSRPYFIPSTIDMSEPNWILMSSGYTGRKFKQIDVFESNTVMWLGQIRGYNTIQFIPKIPCDMMCNILEDTIEEGEIVLFSPAVWNISYLPGEGTENLAIAVGGFSTYW